MEDLKLKEKIMKLMILGFNGTSINNSSPILKYLKIGLGGVILNAKSSDEIEFTNNILSPKQLVTLSDCLQSYSKGHLFIGLDFKGGENSSFKVENGFNCELASHKELGQGSLTNAYIKGGETARSLESLGINLNFGNSLALMNDNYNNDDRFASSALDLISCVTSYSNGQNHNSNALSICYKDVWENTSNINEHYDILYKLINDPTLKVDMIQISANAFVDGDLYNLINNVIRGQMGFNGLIIAQDYETSAAKDKYTLQEYIKKGLLCGVNMFVISNSTQHSIHYMDDLFSDLIYDFYSHGVYEELINKSIYRISAYKTLKFNNVKKVA